MLESTFLHLPGVGAASERSLWERGCANWACYLAEFDRYPLDGLDCRSLCDGVSESVRALEAGDAAFFRRGLGDRESWRAFPEFRRDAVYLDIETDGGSSASSITTIGVYDGAEYRCFVRGHDLDEFPDAVADAALIVTFFGGGFDLPMLAKRFGDWRGARLHLDLCPTLRRLGYRGGLKRIERELGIERSQETRGLDGLDAVRLWRRYAGLGDQRSLDTLIAYNREDVVNLERLAEIAYDRLRRQTLATPSDT